MTCKVLGDVPVYQKVMDRGLHLQIKAEEGSNMSGFCFGHVFSVLVSIGIDCADSPCAWFLVVFFYDMLFICLFDNKNSISQYINTVFSVNILEAV